MSREVVRLVREDQIEPDRHELERQAAEAQAAAEFAHLEDGMPKALAIAERQVELLKAKRRKKGEAE